MWLKKYKCRQTAYFFTWSFFVVVMWTTSSACRLYGFLQQVTMINIGGLLLATLSILEKVPGDFKLHKHRHMSPAKGQDVLTFFGTCCLILSSHRLRWFRWSSCNTPPLPAWCKVRGVYCQLSCCWRMEWDNWPLLDNWLSDNRASDNWALRQLAFERSQTISSQTIGPWDN